VVVVRCWLSSVSCRVLTVDGRLMFVVGCCWVFGCRVLAVDRRCRLSLNFSIFGAQLWIYEPFLTYIEDGLGSGYDVEGWGDCASLLKVGNPELASCKLPLCVRFFL